MIKRKMRGISGKSLFRGSNARLFAVAMTFLATMGTLLAPVARAANDLYWDTNGTIGGSGPATGAWGTDNFWNSDLLGGPAGAFQSTTGNTNDLHFSAGITGTGGTVTIVGDQAANSIIFENDVALTLSGGNSIALGGGGGANPGIFVSSNVTAANAISTALVLGSPATTIQNAGTGVLTLTGGTTGTSSLTLNNNSSNATGITLSTGSLNHTGTITNAGSGTGGVLISSVIDTNVTGVVQNSATSTLTLSGANTYSGSTTINAGTLQLSGASGALAFSGSALTLNGGLFVIDNTGAGANNLDRINDSQAMALKGGSFIYKGSDQAATDSSETIGAITGTGNSTVTVNFGGTNGATLTATSFGHAVGNATHLVNGLNLGSNSTDTTRFARFLVNSTNPTLTGTTLAQTSGINAASRNTQIVPFLVGEAASGTGGLGTSTGIANTFVTYVGGSGFRPLNPTDEFTNNATTTGNNIYITAATPATSNAVNSLVINGGDLAINTGITLTNTSGAMLFASSNAISGAGTGTLAFGATEPQITVNSGVTGVIGAIISGTNGLTKSGAGTLALSGANTFTGALRLDAGALIGKTSAAALGAGTLTLNGGNLILQDNSGLNFARATTVAGNATITSDVVTSGIAGANQSLGTLSIGAFTLNTAAGGNVGSGTAAVTVTSTTLTGNAVFNTGANTLLNLGAISGAFTLNKNGPGALTIGLGGAHK